MEPIVVLDLEWNNAYSRRSKAYLNEIIQFGAVKADAGLHAVDQFSCFVQPQVGKKLTEKIASLTSITEEELQGGCRFMRAVSQFRRWAGDCLLMTWGTSDIMTLIDNCRYFNASDRIPFLQSYVDLQAYCEARLQSGSGQQMGLSKAAELLGIDESAFGHHRALDDSLLALECLRRVYDPAALAGFVQNARERAFYDRMEFRTSYICDPNDPALRDVDWRFHCAACGAAAVQQEPWKLRCKSFQAKFRCPACGLRFVGRVQCKRKYEGLVVRKSAHPCQEEPAAQPAGATAQEE